jgi:hypothetical protein
MDQRPGNTAAFDPFWYTVWSYQLDKYMYILYIYA